MILGKARNAIQSEAGLWMSSAFGASLFLSLVVLSHFGVGERGTHAALAATARFSFLFFGAAYAGGALKALFGAAFLPLQKRGREFGLAFAAALLVHIGLVAWLCWIGDVPSLRTFVFFGIAAVFTYLLALASFGNIREAIGPRLWWLLRTVGMNYIAYAFFKDFMKHPLQGDIRHIVEYLPFATLAAVGPLLRFAAWTLSREHDVRAGMAGSARVLNAKPTQNGLHPVSGRSLVRHSPAEQSKQQGFGVNDHEQ